MAKPKVSKLQAQKEERKIEYVEGDEAFQNFVNLARRVISVPKSEIDELERNRKKKA